MDEPSWWPLTVLSSRARGGGMTLIAAATSRGTQVLVTFIAARMLAPADFGTFSLVAVTVASVATLSSVGVGVSCNRVASESRPKGTEKTSATFTLSALLIIPLALVFSLAFGQLVIASLADTLSVVSTLGLVALVAAAIGLNGAVEGVFYGLRRFDSLAVIAAVVLCLSVGFSVVAILWMGLLGALIGLAFHRCLALLLGLLILRRMSFVRFNLGSLRRERQHAFSVFRSVSLPMAAAGAMSGPVIAIAFAVLNGSSGPTAVASLNLGYQLFLVLTFPAGAMSHFLLARIAGRGPRAKLDFRRGLALAAVYGVVAFVVLALCGRLVLELVAPEVSISGALLACIGAAAATYILSTPFLAAWPATGHAYPVVLSQVAFSLCVLVGALAFGNDAGADGTAGILAIGFAAQLVTHLALWASSGARRL